MIEKLQTPNKLNRLVIEPSYRKNSFDSHGVDCPFPFFHDGKYYLTYVGFDGAGYRTGLASSDNLLTWKKEGILLDRGPQGSVTEFNVALTGILRDNELFGNAELKKVDDRFIGTYHAYPAPGYEAGPAVIGLCFSHDLRHWQLTDPILRAEDGLAWERGGLYKSWLMEHAGIYYLFYNAKNQPNWPWLEQTGVATSKDLKTWRRFEGNPILKVGPTGSFDDLFASDPCVFCADNTWVLFYFGNSTDGHARESAAFSNDLFTWTKSDRILIDIGPAGSIDSRHAHKPGIITKDGKLFHFYCAVAPNPGKNIGDVETAEFRGISLATSEITQESS